jgi:catechol 2,3-dioxygenase-like lactoylglutathione lyase family enzyme
MVYWLESGQLVRQAGRNNMADQATPNLPSRNFDTTIDFYTALGFELSWRDKSWLILQRGTVMLEFFPYPDLDPYTSSFGACLRLDNVDSFYATCLNAGIAETRIGFPRLHPIEMQGFGLRIGALLDIDGSLLRIISND